MRKLTIGLVSNPQTGEQQIVVDLGCCEDCTPVEHEAEHRVLVETLLNSSIDAIMEKDGITVTRDEDCKEAPAQSEPQQRDERRIEQQQT